MSKRLELLEKLVASGAADSFGVYALAMELRKLGEVDRAVATFESLRDRDARYVPMYLMAAQTLADASRPAEARSWVEQGIAQAREQGEAKALGELEALLAVLG